MTDDLNCGSCGHECYIQDLHGLGDPWDAGGSCNEGTCGSVWSGCDNDEYPTCRKLLEAQGLECGTGCNAMTPGATVLYFDFEEFGGGSCWLQMSPTEEYSLGCDDPLPWDPDHEAESVACCAAQ